MDEPPCLCSPSANAVSQLRDISIGSRKSSTCLQDRGFTTEGELTGLFDDNYRAAGWVPGWTDITGIPPGIVVGKQACGAGLKVAGADGAGALLCLPDQDTLGGLSCPAGAVAASDGTAWTCGGGSGSGIDADTVDGKQASDFMAAGTDDWVNTAGDTMTGPLQLPSDGLVVGTSQLVLANGRVGVGTASPDGDAAERRRAPNNAEGW